MKVYEKVRAYIDKMQFEQGFVAKNPEYQIQISKQL